MSTERVEFLELCKARLVGALNNDPSARDVPALSRELRNVVAELERLSVGEVSPEREAVDAVAEQVAALRLVK